MTEKELKGLAILAMAAIGVTLLLWVDWRIFAGVFCMMWANNFAKQT